MIQNVNSNNKISFLLPKRYSIDIEALNLLASKTEYMLCSCAYCEQSGKHRLDYDVLLPNNLYLQKESFSLEEFIRECMKLFEIVQQRKLNLANFSLGLQYIFNEQGKYRFIYIPIHSKKAASQKKVIINLLKQLKSRDVRCIELLKRVKKAKTDAELVMYLQGYTAVSDMVEYTDSEKETTLLSQQQVVDEPETEGENTILSQHTTAFLPSDSAECETTFLSDNMVHSQIKETSADGEYELYLLRVCSGEQIHINKSEYSIGKDMNTMDYILGNESVSRNHATIYKEDNKFYLTDNGSTNGTTMEGIRVNTGERVELSEGDIISLGNEVFQVLLERKVL